MAVLGLSPVIARYDHVLVDLDGCLWLGDEPRAGAAAAVAALREAGKGLAFLSDDMGHAPEEFVRKLWRLGFRASVDEVVTCGAALQFVLADRAPGGAAFVIGTLALIDHVAGAGLRIVNNTEFASRADLVVVGAHERFDFRELRIAAQALSRGAELIAASRAATVAGPDGPWPGTGAILAAVETAAGRRADRVVGRPEPDMYATARDRLGAGRYLAVGSDVAGARQAGMDSARVPADDSPWEAAEPRPTHTAPSLAELVLA